MNFWLKEHKKAKDVIKNSHLYLVKGDTSLILMQDLDLKVSWKNDTKDHIEILGIVMFNSLHEKIWESKCYLIWHPKDTITVSFYDFKVGKWLLEDLI